jgi:hypothetical protein
MNITEIRVLDAAHHICAVAERSLKSYPSDPRPADVAINELSGIITLLTFADSDAESMRTIARVAEERERLWDAARKARLEHPRAITGRATAGAGVLR